MRLFIVLLAFVGFGAFAANAANGPDSLNVAEEKQQALPDLSKYRQTVTFIDPIKDIKALAYQPETRPTNGAAEVRLKIDWQSPPSIERLTEIYRKKSLKPVQGFRVQIFMGDNQGANGAKEKFLAAYEEVELYSFFDRPSFKVRVGNFSSRYDAEKFASQLKSLFPGAFVVPDQVKIGE